MAEPMRRQLIEQIQGVRAKEAQILSLLDSMIASADDAESIDQLRRQREQAAHREGALRKRLDDLGAREADEAADGRGAHQQHGGDGTQEARAGYLVEHLTVSYDLLERLAQQANDAKTARVARRNKTAKEGAAERISTNWDRITRSSRFDGWFS